MPHQKRKSDVQPGRGNNEKRARNEAVLGEVGVPTSGVPEENPPPKVNAPIPEPPTNAYWRVLRLPMGRGVDPAAVMSASSRIRRDSGVAVYCDDVVFVHNSSPPTDSKEPH